MKRACGTRVLCYHIPVATNKPLEAEPEVSNLADTAYQYLLDRILRGDLPLGAEILRRQVAAELNMSVLPVSEALQRLEQELLVESGRRVGTRVRIPTPQEIRGFCIVREALETEAARLFAERATARERDEIQEAATQLDALYEESAAQARDASPESLHHLRIRHMEFHLKVADGAACPYLRQQVEKNQHLVFNCFYDKLFGNRRLPREWHVTLARTLASGDVEASDRAMRRHVRHHLEEIMYRLEPYLSLDRERIVQSIDAPRG